MALISEPVIQRIAAEARDAFFGRIAELLPPNCPGDFSPHDTVTFERVTEQVVRTLASNLPED